MQAKVLNTSTKHTAREKKAGRIAKSALRLFSNRGYTATTVGDIAKASGVGKGTLYEYFATKEDIFVAALKVWMARFEDRLEKRLQGIADPVQKLHAIAETNIALVDAIDPAVLRLSAEFLQQSLLEDGVLYKRRYLIKEIYTGQCRVVTDILLEGVSQGLFRPEIARDAEKIAINLLACFDGIFLHCVLSENYFDLRDQVDFYMANLIRSVRVNEEKPHQAASNSIKEPLDPKVSLQN
jgi:AcrR family transcriptional regulator